MNSASLQTDMSSTLRRKRRNRHPFTLLEVMVVILLMTLCLGWMGIKSVQAIREARLERAVRDVAARIQLAQLIALSHAADATIHLTIDENGLHVQLEGEFSDRYRRAIDRWRPVEGVEKIGWNGALYPMVSIPLEAGRSNRSAAGLLLLQGGGGRERFLLLEGYPSAPRIFSGEVALPSAALPPYPQELAHACS